ncbi:siderophore-interacting protein [Pseudoclavibacter sp. AY1H1]|uniref:siderophore-interacting protein n=1 Tax=Pseudoclavibacter sp. AY1H1 TaxID=2080584 RepID=UPI000CE7D164|nr:siderophore-interacting protein [Pseudoclavibacter sp. AY1H1]PPF37127.1 hypothetical protein C5E05_09290 [Pseudoclavibacter sp. AY1H1]
MTALTEAGTESETAGSGYVERIHRAVVTGVRQLGPGMLRVTFGGDDLLDYPTTGIGDEYVRLFFPDEAHLEPRLPFVSGRGWDYEEGVEPSQMRTYTIRDHRPGEIDIDFVVHEGGIASTWVLGAKPGYVLGINPPRDLYALPEGVTKQVLICDEPALPAALRIAELTPHVETEIVCEIRDAGYELLPSVELKAAHWVRGSGNGHRPSRLVEAVRRLDIPNDGSVYVWVAGETRVTREVRSHLRHTLGLPGSAYKVVGYWTYEVEAWSAKWEALDESIKQQIMDLYGETGDGEPEMDEETRMDEVFRIYASVGL